MRYARGLRAGWASDDRFDARIGPNRPQRIVQERDRLPPNTPAENKSAMRAELERLVAAYVPRPKTLKVERAYVRSEAASDLEARREAARWARYRSLGEWN